MKIKKEYPPNIHRIKTVLPFSEKNIYCFGDTIYNPCGEEIPQDIHYHESIHKRQQGDNPELWWERYLADSEFRKSQEIEAYAEQYRFLKKILTSSLLKEALEEFAENLSKMYNISLSVSQAETAIRKYAL